MGNFGKPRGDFGSKPYRKPFGFGGGAGARNGGGNGGSDRPMHKATCSKCKSECSLPFRPNGTKPVFCSNCFEREDKAPRFGDRAPERRSFGDRGNDRGGSDYAPARSFAPAAAPASMPSNVATKESVEALKKQLDVIYSKLEYIVKLVSPVVTVEPVVEEEEKPKAKKAKVAKK